MNIPDPSLYRPCAGLMIINDQGKVFVGKRIDSRESGWWQMPQGGIDKGEDVRLAALRELEEETGLTPDKVTILAQSPQELFYDLPEQLKGKLWKGRYIGQRQIWFLLRFTGQDADIRLDAHDPPEFCEWQWVPPSRLPDMIIPFKADIYRAVLDIFRDFI